MKMAQKTKQKQKLNVEFCLMFKSRLDSVFSTCVVTSVTDNQLILLGMKATRQH